MSREKSKRWRFRPGAKPVCTSADFWHDVMHANRPAAARLLHNQKDAARIENAVRTLAEFFVAVSQARLWLGSDACNVPSQRPKPKPMPDTETPGPQPEESRVYSVRTGARRGHSGSPAGPA